MSTKNVRFLYNNIAAATLSTVTASSELSGFEVENLFDSYRFTGWRPSGFFEITASNKEIYINDGSDKTVSLTVATYTTGALLAAHIQTQLNASSTNWTCTYSSTTFKFTIGRSSGTALLRLATTTNAAWDTIGYIGVVNDDVGTGQAADVVRVHTSEWVHFDLGEAREITSIIAIGPASTDFSIESTVTVTIKANNVDSFAAAPLSVTVTPDNNGFLKFLDAIADTTYRYWKIEFTDRENSSGPSVFDIRVLYLGDYVSLTDRNLNNGFSLNYEDLSLREENDSGVPFFRLKPKLCTINNFNVEWNKTTDRIKIRDLYNEVGNSIPFFISLDPEADISENILEHTKYVTVDGNLDQNHQRFNYFSQGLSFREVAG